MRKWRIYENAHCSYGSLKVLLPLRVHIILFTMLSLVFLCAEQIIDILHVFAQYTDSLENSIGYLRIVSFALLAMSYTAMYIDWASVAERKEKLKKGLNVKHQYVVLCSIVQHDQELHWVSCMVL